MSNLSTLEIVALVIGILAGIFQILEFLIPQIRKRLPEILQHPIFRYLLVLLVGIAIGAVVIPHKSAAELATQAIYREYEWQWAGESWYGRVVLDKNKEGKNVVTQARVGLIDKIVKPNNADLTQIDGMIMELIDGSFNILDNDHIAVDLSVRKKSRRTDAIDTEEIKGILQKNICYAGKVTYTSKTLNEGSFEGDMILNGYTSSVGNVVNDWFRKPGPDWASYGK